MWLVQRPCLIKEINISSLSLYTEAHACTSGFGVGRVEPTSFLLAVDIMLRRICTLGNGWNR